jgi:hypothetical protein
MMTASDVVGLCTTAGGRLELGILEGSGAIEDALKKSPSAEKALGELLRTMPRAERKRIRARFLARQSDIANQMRLLNRERIALALALEALNSIRDHLRLV